MNIAVVPLPPVASFLAFLSCISVAFLVLLKDRSKHLNQSFFLITILAGIWTAFPFLIWIPEDKDHAFLMGKLIHLFAPFVPTAFYYFVNVFLGLHGRPKEKTLLILFFSISTVFALGAFHPMLLEGIYRKNGLYIPVPGVFYIYFALFFGGICGLAFFKCLAGYKVSVGARKNQIKYVLTSFAFAYSAGLLHFIGTFLRVEPFPHDFLLILFAATITYAIAKHRLMDITVVMHKGLTYALLLVCTLLPAYIAVTITQRATFYSLPPLFAGTLLFAFSLWIFIQNYYALSNQTLGLLALACSLWQFGFFMIYTATRAQDTIFLGKIMYIGILYIPALFTHFTRSFLKYRDSPAQTAIPYIISTGFLLLLPTPYLLDGYHEYYWGHYPKAGLLHPLFLTFFAVFSGVSLYMLYSSYKSKELNDPNAAKRIKYVFWAFLIGHLASIDFIQAYDVEAYPTGFIFITLWIFMVSFATARYQLLDIPISIPKNTIFWYARDFVVILLSYFAIVALTWSFTGSPHYILSGVLLALFSVLSELLVPLQKNMEKMIGQTFFKQRHDALETLTNFSQDLVTILDLNDLNTRFLNTVLRTLEISEISLFLLDKEKDVFVLASSKGSSSDQLQGYALPSNHPLLSYFHTNKTSLIREEFEASNHSEKEPILHTLKEMRAEITFPLINKDRLVGFCNLGPRSSHQMYSDEELSLITTLAQNAAIALDNALLYEDWKRSQLLMKRTDRLRSLETIAGGFAHEIRNPLTSIKTFIQLAPERREDGEFITDFSRVVNEDVNRIERLIEEILDYARYMKPRLTEENLNEIVTSCLYFVEVKAGSLGIILEKDLSKNLPYVMVDRQQFKQVLLNLLLNALEALKQTSGKITIKTHRLIKNSGDEWVQIEVSDTGPGISPSNLEHIFDPFYTTKHESGEHEGTGLGLAIVHQIVQEHHGTIHVESQPNMGTTFFVEIPASPCRAEPNSVTGGT